MSESTSGLYVCNKCKEAGDEFKVPADLFGVEFMKAHLKEKHPHYPERKEQK